MARFAMLALVLLLLAPPALAGEKKADDEAKPDDAATLRAKAALDVFRKEFKAEDPEDRMEAVAGLREHRHALVVREIGRTGLVDPEPGVRQVAARVLGFMKEQAAEAGKLLTAALMKNEAEPETQIAIVRAIRKLEYTGAREELTKAARHFLEEEYQFVTNEVLITFGAQKDVHALPFLLVLYEYEGVYLRGRRGPLVRAANDAEAKRIYEKKYGHLKNPQGKPETVVRYWQQEMLNAIKAITGRTFEDAAEFRDWLEKNCRKLGIKRSDIPKKMRNVKSAGLGPQGQGRAGAGR